MPRRKPAPPPSARLRQNITVLAAHLMAEEGIDDYGFAKRKAARSLGASESEALPGNDEVEQALREYQAIYQEDEHPERLHDLRSTAYEVMDMLTAFHPYLTGAVLDGTAGRYAGIEIDLFADSSKDVEIELLSRGIDYVPLGIRRPTPHSPETRLQFEWDETPVTLSVFPLVAERSQRREPHKGKVSARANLAAVAALLNAEPAA